MPKANAYAASVSMDQEWPVPVQHMITFTITKNFHDKSVLVIDLIDKEILRKFLKISKTQFVDIVTDYYTIKKGIGKTGTSSFTIKMLFLKRSHNTELKFHWYPAGVLESNEAELKGDQNLIYSSKIQLREKWKIKITMEILETINTGSNSDIATAERVYLSDEKYFHHGKIAKITCSAFDGLPESRVGVNGLSVKRFRDTAYDKNLNTWIGYVTLSVTDHNSNITCHVGDIGESKSYQIKVNRKSKYRAGSIVFEYLRMNRFDWLDSAVNGIMVCVCVCVCD